MGGVGWGVRRERKPSCHVSTHLTINHIPWGTELKTCDNWSGLIICIAEGAIYPSESRAKPTVKASPLSWSPCLSPAHIFCLFAWRVLLNTQSCFYCFFSLFLTVYRFGSWYFQVAHLSPCPWLKKRGGKESPQPADLTFWLYPSEENLSEGQRPRRFWRQPLDDQCHYGNVRRNLRESSPFVMVCERRHRLIWSNR